MTLLTNSSDRLWQVHNLEQANETAGDSRVDATERMPQKLWEQWAEHRQLKPENWGRLHTQTSSPFVEFLDDAWAAGARSQLLRTKNKRARANINATEGMLASKN
jgi:hypothetical protein